MTPAERVESCFAVARSTAFPAEREAAVAIGIRLATGAGLDLDDFDIPGRPRTRKARTARPSPPPRAPEIDVVDAVRRYGDTLDRVAASVGASADETVYAARRRNFDAAVADARERDDRRALAGAAARQAADLLWDAGMRCYLVDKATMTWGIDVDGHLHQAGSALLIEFARIVAENGADVVRETLRAAA